MSREVVVAKLVAIEPELMKALPSCPWNDSGTESGLCACEHCTIVKKHRELIAMIQSAT